MTTRDEANYKHLTSFCSFLLFCLVPAELFTPVAPDKALLGHVSSSLNNTNVMECFKLCLVTTQCKSFNFCRHLKTCEVSDSTTTGSAYGLEYQQGCNYYEPESYQGITP